ncbi:ATP-dependent nuclease [Helicobacter aurati]|uniref:ATP-dependent nuclease n=1 Tax=Helicobacter aurati TaxID=137778 RepID=A0A3D8J989_9HELI|nr:ATP-dependent nuclease [Helicobacter aurati]RDU73434.1 ATP-dependent nuclease [Helicobacter aurati]
MYTNNLSTNNSSWLPATCLLIIFLALSNQTICAQTTTNNKIAQDSAMIKAADLWINGQYVEAKKIYAELFAETKDLHFLKQMALIQNEAGNFENALHLAMQYQAQSHDTDDVDINAIIAEGHIRKGEYNLAAILLEKIITTNPNIQFHYILGNLYLQEQQFDKALQHFLIVYNDAMSSGSKIKQEVLYQIVTIYFNKQEIQKALHYLNNFIAGNESLTNLQNFIALYTKINQIDALQDSLTKRFINSQNIDNARLLVSFLVQFQKYQEAILFLQKNQMILGQDAKEMLMQVYSANNQFQEAFIIAKELYEDTKIKSFLGLSAVYQYETLESKNQHTLTPIIKSLKEVITYRNKKLAGNNQKPNKEDAFFYNFLGYLLIDYDIDLHTGMQYVSLAVSIEPDSSEYLDSLAWGFYKSGDCQKARETFNLITETQIQNIEELQKHREIIFQCK